MTALPDDTLWKIYCKLTEEIPSSSKASEKKNKKPVNQDMVLKVCVQDFLKSKGFGEVPINQIITFFKPIDDSRIDLVIKAPTDSKNLVFTIPINFEDHFLPRNTSSEDCTVLNQSDFTEDLKRYAD